MKLKDLTEGITDVLYHSISLEQAANVIRTNRFMLSFAHSEESKMQIPRKKYFFMSTSRIKTNRFIKSSLRDVVLNLDGRKLSYKYPGRPIYFFTNQLKNTEDRIAKRHDFDENEDRIFHDKPYIENAKDYILEVHIFLYLIPSIMKHKDDEEQLAKLAEIYKDDINYVEFIKNHIGDKPVYIYSNRNDFIIQNKLKARKIKSIGSYDSSKIKDQLSNEYDFLTNTPTKQKTPHRRLKYFYELLSSQDLSSDAQDFLNQMMKNKNISLWASVFVHAGSEQRRFTYDTGKIAEIMKKLKLYSSEDVIRYIYDKWGSRT